MSTFKDRLKRAADHAGVEFSQAAIAKSLGIRRRQTVDRWFEDSEPRQDMIFHIAATWKVNSEWLGTGAGDMHHKPPAGLSQREQEILKTYRELDSERRTSLYTIAKALAKAVVLVTFVVFFAQPQPSHSAFNIKWPEYALHAIRRWLQTFVLKQPYLFV
jgi:hypothetical protein